MVEASLAAASASPAWLLSRISRTFTKVVRLNVDIVFRSATAMPPRVGERGLGVFDYWMSKRH